MTTSFDHATRNLRVGKKCIRLDYLTSLVDGQAINTLIAGLLLISDDSQIENQLITGSLLVTTEKPLAKKMFYSGCAVLTYQECFYVVETRSYPGRSIGQPDTEKTIRGAKDGFNENLIMNVGLIRRRIRHEALVMQIMSIGRVSQMDVCLCYMDDRVDIKLLGKIKNRLSKINVEEVTMSDRAIEELILEQSFHPFPLVRYCERPDIVAAEVIKGHIALIVDTTSSVILLPVHLSDLLEHVQEHRETPLVGTMIRLIRISAILLSIYLVPLWLSVIQNPNLSRLFFLRPPEEEVLSLGLQIFIAEGAIELLRLATIYTPNELSSAMGLVAALLLGQMAIDLGVFLPEVLLYVAISNVAGFATPSYELSLANKLVKWWMILSTLIAGKYGLVTFHFIFLSYLIHVRCFHFSYAYPLVPFDGKALLHFILRLPKKSQS